MRPLVRSAVVSVLGLSAILANTPLSAQTCAPGQYLAPAATYSAGSYAIATVAADFNADGRSDLAVANYGSSSVSILLSTAPGSFGPAVPVPFPTGPVNLAAGDFDEDGIIDLAAALLNSNDLAVALGRGTGGTGDGTFDEGIAFDTGASPRDVTVADVDADGHQDLVAAGTSAVCVHLGRGDGTFEAFVAYPTPNPWEVAIADLNADGAIDLAVANGTVGEVSILLGQFTGGVPNGTFVSGAPVLLALGQPDIAIADLNADGAPDIAVPSGGEVVILTNLIGPSGGTATFTTLPFGVGGNLSGIACADINRDGRPDVVVTRAEIGALALLVAEPPALTGGSPEFAAPEWYPAGNGVVGVLAADLDGDGTPDVVTSNTGSASVSVLLGTCDGDPPPTPVISGVTPRYGLPGDVITIVGLNFGDAPEVRFHLTPATVLDVGPGGIHAVVPEGAAPGPISVTTPEGTATTSFWFQIGRPPTITEFTPVAGRVGDVVTISGAQLGTAIRVSFGGASSDADFTVESDALLRAVVDAAAADGPITIENPIGITTSGLAFTVLPPDSAPAMVSVTDVPGDQGGFVSVRWRPSDLDRAPTELVTGYRLWRRAPAGIAPRPEWRMRATSAGSTAAPVYWEAIATLPAAYLEGYAFTAGTPQDSMQAGNPYTAFFVQAVTADAMRFYDSGVDSGYSVDNLSPAEPGDFVVRADALGGMRLEWRAPSDADLDRFHLHRGTSAGFERDASNRIATVREPGYHDPAGKSGDYYQLVAVDRHGNESVPAVASGAAPAPPSYAFEFRGARPNPARHGATTIRFTVPVPGPVRLELFDAAGRRVRRHEELITAAGPGEISWEGRPSLAPGVYQLRLSHGARSATMRLVVVP